VLLASRDGRDGSIQVQQDFELEMTRLGAGQRRARPLGEKRHAWVHVARGSVTVNEAELAEGDGAAVSEERRLEFEAGSDAEILVFDLA
jgi:redox-sensitive bicupin YhaK (pirin superfamily)